MDRRRIPKAVLEKLLLVYTSNMNHFRTLMTCFDAKIALYKRRRRQNLLKIQKLRQEQLLLLTALQYNATKRSWKLDRISEFWEVQCQHSGDEFFRKQFHMNRASFNILTRLLQNVRKTDTSLRTAVPLEKRVAISLFVLCSTVRYKVAAELFGVGVSTVAVIVIDFCKEVWRSMSKEYINKLPPTQETVAECLEGFQRFGMPQCLGVIDTCHIEVIPQNHLATDYENVDYWYSIILLALVDYRHRFLYMNVGASGACTSSDIYESSLLKELLSEDEILLANKKYLNDDDVEIPVWILGDSTFKLSSTLMKPYKSDNAQLTIEQEFFNDKLDEYRKAFSVRAFDKLKARFRRIAKSVENRGHNAPTIVRACCVLHNYLIERHDNFDEVWLQELQQGLKPKKNPKVEIDDADDDGSDEFNTAELIRATLCHFIFDRSGVEGSVDECNGDSAAEDAGGGDPLFINGDEGAGVDEDGVGDESPRSNCVYYDGSDVME